MPAMGDDGTQLVEAKLEKLDLHKSSIEELQLARVVTRTPQVLSLVNYSSDNDESDPDEEDGRLHTTREFHENGNVKHSQTFQYCKTRLGKPYKRVVEEKHFDTDGVCRLDVHFAIGSPYLSRKHYYATQTLKSESLFWVDDEYTMTMHKVGHWRTYYEEGNIKSELEYKDGVRIGFCKRYARDGAIEWVKDYTKDYAARIDEFNERKGNLSLSVMDACKALGFDGLPSSKREVDSNFRATCAPFHPDRTSDPNATEEFLRLSRARDTLRAYFETHGLADE